MSISICMPGYDDWFSINLDPFAINFHPYPFRKQSFHDACDHTARLIAGDFDNLYLAFSGGYDSELVANVLLRNGIPFTPFIWRDRRSRETDFALYWCRKNRVEPRIFDGDLLDLKIDKILKGLAKKFGSKDHVGAINLMIAEMIEKENGALITGTGIVASGGLDYPDVMSPDTDWQKNEIFVDLLSPRHPGSFFLYTPEILLAYAEEVDQTLPTQEAKEILYDLSFRPKIKPYHAWLGSDMSDDPRDHHSTGSINDLVDYLSEFTLDRGSPLNPSHIRDSRDIA